MSEDVKSILRVSTAEIGECLNFDRDSLKGYKAESKLKRVILQNSKEVLDHLFNKFKIPPIISIRSEGIKDLKTNKILYEEFDTVELIRLKITDFNSTKCLKLLDIYEEKGLISLLNAIQYLSPIQKV